LQDLQNLFDAFGHDHLGCIVTGWVAKTATISRLLSGRLPAWRRINRNPDMQFLDLNRHGLLTALY
jgi:hypothetical protein